MTYKNINTGETMDQDQYLVQQIERYMTELTSEEQSEWQSLYGKAAVKVWSVQNPDPQWKKEEKEVTLANEKAMAKVNTTSSLPPRRQSQENDKSERPNIPPKRSMSSVRETSGSMTVENNSESIRVPTIGVPPKRNAAGSSTPPRRNATGSSIPPKRSANTEEPVKSSESSFKRPPNRRAAITSIPPKRNVRNADERPKEEQYKQGYSRDELWRMAKEDPYYDETLTEDDGVYNRFVKMEYKQILLIGGLLVVCFVLLFLVVYVLMN